MGKIAYIYPGQGAQKPGMGKDFYENSPASREVFDRASQLLGLDMKALCFGEDPRLDITEYTQAAMVTTSLAMTAEMEKRGLPKPRVTAGLSLGEYCAMAAAGVLRTEDAICAVRRRGILMQEAVPAGKGAMSAVLAMTAEAAEQAISSIADVQIANYNCPGQLVISGKTEAVAQAEEALKAAGAKRVVRLNVSGPFHSPLLKKAGEQLFEELQAIPVMEHAIPYVANVTAQYVYGTEEVRELLKRQVYSPVKWQQSVEAMLADGVDTFVEIGPGRTLTSFIRKIDRGAKTFNVEKWEDLEQIWNQ